MTPVDKQKFDQAVTLAQAGSKQEAYTILSQLAPSNPDDSNILLWMAFTASDPARARLMLGKVALLDPDNPALESAKNWLTTQDNRPQPSAPPSVLVATPPVASDAPTPVKPNARPSSNGSAKPETTATPAKSLITIRPPKTRVERIMTIGLTAAAGMVAIFLLFVVLLVTGILGTSSPTQTLPVYGNGVRLELNKADRDSVLGSINLNNRNALDSPNTDFYVVKNTERNKVMDFYDTELKKQSWLVSPRLSGTNVTGGAYLKGSQTIIVRLASGNNVPPNVLSRLKPDEVLMIVISVALENKLPTLKS